jgi:hypothetical protein
LSSCLSSTIGIMAGSTVAPAATAFDVVMISALGHRSGGRPSGPPAPLMPFRAKARLEETHFAPGHLLDAGS